MNIKNGMSADKPPIKTQRQMTVKTRVRVLVRRVNHLRLHSLRFGRYNLSAESGIRLVLREPKEFKRPNRIVAHGFIAIEKYLLNELAELQEENEHFEEIKLRRIV